MDFTKWWDVEFNIVDAVLEHNRQHFRKTSVPITRIFIQDKTYQLMLDNKSLLSKSPVVMSRTRFLDNIYMVVFSAIPFVTFFVYDCDILIEPPTS